MRTFEPKSSQVLWIGYILTVPCVYISILLVDANCIMYLSEMSPATGGNNYTSSHYILLLNKRASVEVSVLGVSFFAEKHIMFFSGYGVTKVCSSTLDSC